jgi:hypothetical protein
VEKATGAFVGSLSRRARQTSVGSLPRIGEAHAAARVSHRPSPPPTCHACVTARHISSLRNTHKWNVVQLYATTTAAVSRIWRSLKRLLNFHYICSTNAKDVNVHAWCILSPQSQTANAPNYRRCTAPAAVFDHLTTLR